MKQLLIFTALLSSFMFFAYFTNKSDLDKIKSGKTIEFEVIDKDYKEKTFQFRIEKGNIGYISVNDQHDNYKYTVNYKGSVIQFKSDVSDFELNFIGEKLRYVRNELKSNIDGICGIVVYQK